MNNKRAQAAMEFLMTYGWAILVVMLVIGALAYFGVLNPEAMLPEKCMLPIGINCEEHLVKGGADGGVMFDIRNGMGNNIEITSFKVTREGESTVTCIKTPVTPIPINNGESASIKIPSSGASDAFDGDEYAADTNGCIEAELGNLGTKYRYALEVIYNKENKEDFDHTVTGELLTKVE